MLTFTEVMLYSNSEIRTSTPGPSMSVSTGMFLTERIYQAEMVNKPARARAPNANPATWPSDRSNPVDSLPVDPSTLSISTGGLDGVPVGDSDGSSDGGKEGAMVGDDEGTSVGDTVGETEGDNVLGVAEGLVVGDVEGAFVGETVGNAVACGKSV